MPTKPSSLFIIAAILSSSTLCLATATAATITNKITGVGLPSTKGYTAPHICIQNQDGAVTYDLQPDATIDPYKYSGNPYYAGAQLRFGGCDPNNTYLGYMGISYPPAIASYTPPGGAHIAYKNGIIDSNGNLLGAIDYTPIDPNFNLNKASGGERKLSFVGINLSGLEFSKMPDPMTIPNLAEIDKATSNSDLADTNQFIADKINTVRIPLSWGYLQLEGAGKGGINMSYYNNYVKPLLESLTSANVNVIVDLHAYMRYSQFGVEYSGCGPDPSHPCPDGTIDTNTQDYQDIWGKLYDLIAQDDKINKDFIMLDLMNEPVGVDTDTLFNIETDLITMLRKKGFNGYILVEGNSWAGLHSWGQNSYSASSSFRPNALVFTRNNFANHRVTDLSKILINVHQYLDSNFSGTQDSCRNDLDSKGQDGFNLDDFVTYLRENNLKAIVTEFGAGANSDSCSQPLGDFLAYLEKNKDNGQGGFVGWTIWSTGHGWGNYNLRVKPTSYQWNILKKHI